MGLLVEGEEQEGSQSRALERVAGFDYWLSGMLGKSLTRSEIMVSSFLGGEIISARIKR